jgi:2-(1,2-epoxy-1,2-dihydrophenyl)acetyl-CoA isomerase
MSYTDLLLEKKDHVAIVTLNAPDKLNALTLDMRKSIGHVVNDIAQDDDVRVVVLTGAGRGFCAGADISVQLARITGKLPPASRFETQQVSGYPYAYAFPRLNKPVIAAVNGVCVGAGFALALSCDIRIASEDAKFGAAQVARGLVPDAGLTFYLPMLAGISNAFKMMFTAEIINAATAKDMGLVTQIVPLENLMSAVMELANKIAQQPPFSVELSKKLVWRSLLDKIDSQLDLESGAQKICFATEDHKASVTAFLNKQPTPQYHGK